MVKQEGEAKLAPAWRFGFVAARGPPQSVAVSPPRQTGPAAVLY
jgi:hypothetical protein